MKIDMKKTKSENSFLDKIIYTQLCCNYYLPVFSYPGINPPLPQVYTWLELGIPSLLARTYRLEVPEIVLYEILRNQKSKIKILAYKVEEYSS